VSKYAKRHYEDVAAILVGLLSRDTEDGEKYAQDVADEFVELFECEHVSWLVMSEDDPNEDAEVCHACEQKLPEKEDPLQATRDAVARSAKRREEAEEYGSY